MGTLKWYARDPLRALSGMMKMTLEECGAYNKILDLIYLHDGALLDDPQEICRWLNCHGKTWKRMRARLLELGKIYIHAGHIHNERADDEIVKIRRRVQSATVAANLKWATYNEIKSLQHAVAMQPTSTKKETLSANVMPIFKGTTEKERK